MAGVRVEAISSLLGKAQQFAAQLDAVGCKRSSEFDLFQENVSALADWHLQCSQQFLRRELSNQNLVHALHAAIDSLNKHNQYMDKNLNKIQCFQWRRRGFPTDLLNALNRVRELIHADPQLVTLTIPTLNSMERHRVVAPAPLPFKSDHKYVPLSASISAVQQALENQEGPQIVNLYGEPGLGKSSLAKYVALHYEQQNEDRIKSAQFRDAIFPDGVQYVLCGQGAKEKTKQLQSELLGNLGVEVGRASQLKNSKITSIQGCDDCSRPSFYTELKLRRCLANKHMLIILDDVWETEVITELFANMKGVKYLVTSQISDIWTAAECIELKRPTETQAREILVNYTEGLAKQEEFPSRVWVNYTTFPVISALLLRKVEVNSH
jgi:hypothetical protein